MKRLTMHRIRLRATFALLTALTASGAAAARGHEGFAHRGYIATALPQHGYPIDHDRNHYWYGGDQWYRREGFDWMMVPGPLGAFVPVLPPYYVTLYVKGIPYYCADDTCYAQTADHEFVVVAPPSGSVD
jgi:hypothetical protein